MGVSSSDCLAQLEEHPLMAVVLGIRPPKMAYFDKSKWGNVCIII